MSKTFDKGVKNLFISHQEQLSDFTAIRDEILKKRTTPLGALFFSDFTLSVIDLYLALIAAKDFYAGEKQIALIETPAARMISEHNLIEQLDLHRKNPINLIRAYRTSGLDELILPAALSSLLSTLHDLVFAKYESDYSTNISELEGFLLQFRELSDEEFAEFKSTEDYNDFKEFLDNLALELKDLQTKLRLIEHDVYDAHPDWEVTFYESKDNPLDARKDRRNQSRARHAYFAKYRNPLRKFEETTRLLTFGYEEVKASLNSVNKSYLPSFEELIATPVTFAYESPIEAVCTGGRESSVTDSLSPYLAEGKQRFVDALHKFFTRRESELPNDCYEREPLKTMAARVFNAHKDFEQIDVAVEEVTPITEAGVEVIDPTALVTASNNRLPAVREGGNDLAVRLVQALESISESVDEHGKILHRIDDRSRNRTVAREEKLQQQAKEERLLEIWEDYLADKHGPNLNKRGKRSIKDLLIHDRLGPMIKRKFGITAIKPLEAAITRARNRRKK